MTSIGKIEKIEDHNLVINKIHAALNIKVAKRSKTSNNSKQAQEQNVANAIK